MVCLKNYYAVSFYSAHEVCEDGSLKPATVPLSVLYATSDGSKKDIERVSTGTKWALENWLKPAAAQL